MQDFPVTGDDYLTPVLFGRLPSNGGVFLAVRLWVIDGEIDKHVWRPCRYSFAVGFDRVFQEKVGSTTHSDTSVLGCQTQKCSYHGSMVNETSDRPKLTPKGAR